MKKLNFKRAIVLGGSKGLGASIAKELKKSCKVVTALSSKDIDTSDLQSVKNFLRRFKSTDILILNSGGPKPLPFDKLDEKIWIRYFKQLFLGFCLILKKIKINNNGYIFYISSSIIKEPTESLIPSSSLRLAFSSVLKSLSLKYSQNGVSVINIAPGPFKTRRVKELVSNLKKFEETLPTKKIGDPKEIGVLVNSIVKHKLKYLSGSTIYLDGNTLKTFH
jgi:3-oxoacyl-[acyl-carrier protein] reductase